MSGLAAPDPPLGLTGTDLLAIDSDRTNQCILLEHRHNQKRVRAPAIGNRFIGIFRSDVCDVRLLNELRESLERQTSRPTRSS